MQKYNLQKWQISFINSWLYNTTLFFFLNLCFWVLYHFEFPFIERYKTYQGNWPWKEDPKAWEELISKTFLLVGFNNFFVIPVA